MTDRLATTYDVFGRDWARGTSPLYEDWATGIAADADILPLIAALPLPMQQPNRIFAAARWAGSPLAPFPLWRDWLLQNWAAVVEVAAARSVQTNEPGRCATILPPLARIDGPVALLEVGTAAGLCLFPDRYSYAYDAPAGIRRLGSDGGPVMPCRIDDDDAVPDHVPEVTWRRGIDLEPMDAGSAETIDWLATLIWPGPDHDGRVARLRGAAALVADDPPEIVRGDLLEALPDVAAQSPADATLVVFHSAVLMYLDDDRRRRFVDLVGGLGARIARRVVWLSNETRGVLSGVAALVPDTVEVKGRFVQSVDGAPVALAGQHGAVYETAPFRG